MKSKRFILIFFIIMQFSRLMSQQITVSLYVRNFRKEGIANSAVYINKSFKGRTDSTGFLKIHLTKGYYYFKIIHKNYFPYLVSYRLNNDTSINIILKRKGVVLSTITVRGKFFEPTYDKISLNLEVVDKIPSLVGEPDVIRLLQILPGVQMGTEGTMGLNVRGGNSSQNLFLLDGVSMYKLSHVFDFMSTVNPFVVKKLDFYKGGFPGYFGNRLSSVVDIKLIDPSVDSSFFKLNIGLLDANIFYNYRINSRNAAYLAFRTTYIDKIAQGLLWGYKKLFPKFIIGQNLPVFAANFYDLYFKFRHKCNNNSNINFLIYSSKDNYAVGQQIFTSEKNYTLNKTYLKWRTDFMSFSYKLSHSGYKLDIQTIALRHYDLFGDLDMQIFNKHNYMSKDDLIFSARKIELKIKIDKRINKNNILIFASNLNSQFFSNQEKYNNMTDFVNFLPFIIFSNSLTDKLTIGRFRIMGVIRMNNYIINNKVNFVFVPRASISYLFNSFSANYIRFSYDESTQPFYQLSNNDAGFQYSVFYPMKSFEKLSRAKQFSAEFFDNLGKSSFSISLYYKRMNNLADIINYGQDAIFIPGNIEFGGKGWAYGMEFFFQHKFRKLALQSSLTLSRAFRQYKEINMGYVYPFKYDRPINFNFLISYRLNKKLNFTIFWTYMSGFCLTLPVTRFWETDDFINWEETYYFTRRNNFRTPPYHRLDFSLNYKKIKRNHTIIWSLGIYNVYNRHNAYNIELINEGNQIYNFPKFYRKEMRIYSLYPILPVASVRIIW